VGEGRGELPGKGNGRRSGTLPLTRTRHSRFTLYLKDKKMKKKREKDKEEMVMMKY
jgi:hypothetical protein